MMIILPVSFLTGSLVDGPLVVIEIFVGTGESLCTRTKSSGEGQGRWDAVLQVCAEAQRVSDKSTGAQVLYIFE